MTRHAYSVATVPELVERFEAIALAQDEAKLLFKTSTYNRLYKQMDVVRSELKSRSGDQRRALLPLLKSTNVQVRLKAAITLLGPMRLPARQILEDICNDKTIPQCIDAGMILQGLDDGSFVPD